MTVDDRCVLYDGDAARISDDGCPWSVVGMLDLGSNRIRNSTYGNIFGF